MFGRRIPLFSILGFKVYADLTWIFLAVLVTWSLAKGLFPQLHPGLDATAYWSMAVVGAIGLFASLILHELSHSLVARRYGMPIGGITLWIFGGVAEMSHEPDSAGQEFRIAIAGPLMSFFLAALFLVLGGLVEAMGAGPELVAVIGYLSTINLVLAIFNLVPAYPLDGGRVLRAALWHWKGNLRTATRWASNAGSGFGIFLIVLGLVSVVSGGFMGGLWWMLIGLFVHTAASSSYRQLEAQRVLTGKPVSEFMSGDVATVPQDITLREFVEDYAYKFHHDFYPVTDRDGHLVACLPVRKVKEVDREEWDEKTIREIADRCSTGNVIRPDSDASELLSKMRSTGNSRVMVVDGEDLVGVVVLKDLLEVISMRLDLEENRD